MHLTCGAADINKRGWTPLALARAIHTRYPDQHLLRIGLYPGFVHVDIRGFLKRISPARWGGDWWKVAA